MCSPNSIHNEAQSEHDNILSCGSKTQRMVSRLTWIEAVTGCRNKDMTGLHQSAVKHNKGKLFVAEFKFGHPEILGRTVAVKYPDGGSVCWDVLACDATGSDWLNGPVDPERRACSRIP